MKVFLRTFGCRANQYDSEAVRELLGRSGAEVVGTPHDADVAIFNSCAVTGAAVADLRQAVRRAAREQPALRSVIMGCASAIDDGTLARLPTVTDVVAGADMGTLAATLSLPLSAGVATTAQTGTRALLRIQDGCDEHCTFCATTLARGAQRSRHPAELLQEAAILAARHPEIVLTGIHIGTWGTDLGSTLGSLVALLIDNIPEVRFRLSSVEASELDATLLALLRGDSSRLAPWLHAPLQSGSDTVLRRMGRHWYTAGSYSAAITGLSEGKQVFGLGADVIAGFPGEAEEDHERTLELVESLPFTSLHVFPYSPRPGTAAPRLGNDVPPATVARRALELRELGRRKAAEYAQRRSGGLADVVVTGAAGKRSGVTGDYLEVGLADPGLPRGHRFAARLESDGARLTAHPLTHP